MFMNPQMLQLALNDLKNTSEEILGCALISNDGLPIVTALNDDTDSDRVGAMTAALLSLGSRVTEELHCGNMNQVIVRGDDGYIIIMQANEDMVLVLTTGEDTTLGFVLFQARTAVKNLQAM